MKKLMLLGGISFLIPVIQSAKKQGYYVITADYLPNNIAHKYSDEYVNVSIIDKEAVLKVAIEKKIDGIISFGVDPGVVTAAYVQEKMRLPQMGPYKSVCILQNKALFRKFLKENNFNTPEARGYTTEAEALNDIDSLNLPVIVKPVDSAGSKGVTKVDSFDKYKEALALAFDKSITGAVIVEEFIEKVGCSSDTDSFLLNGELKFVSFNAQRFDSKAMNPYTPAAFSWPSTFPEYEMYLTNELQRLLTLLGMRTSVFNIETRVSNDGVPYIMECTPRGGGNRLCEMLHYATGVDLITAQVRAAVGDTVEDIVQKSYNGYWAEIILHADRDGVFSELFIEPSLPASIIEIDMWVKQGEEVHAFNGANDAIGTLVLQFENQETLEEVVEEPSKWLKVCVN